MRMPQRKSGVRSRFSSRGDRTPATEQLEPRILLSGFMAYNDTVAGPQTHAFATLYADNGGDSSGQLRNIATGAYLPLLLSTFAVGVNFGGTGANPNVGTDAYAIFAGKVDFSSSDGNNSLEISGDDSYTYEFTNLNPGNAYEFAGTAIRGNAGYTDRWTLVTLLDADGFTAAHSSGVGIVTDGLGANQVALWTGHNSAASQGFVVHWTNIDPGVDGAFQVVSQQYTGAVPTSVDPDGVANGDKGYGLNGIRLIENVPTGPPAVVNTPATNVEAFAAEIGGRITTTGGEAPNVTIYYGHNDGGDDPGAWDHSINLGHQLDTFSDVVGGLSQATPYYFRARAENSIGTAWAPTTESFTTLTATAPSVVNQPATNVGAFSAWLNGQVTDTGNDSPLVRVYYGQSDGGAVPGAWDDSVELDAQSGAFVAVVDNLDPETTYFYTAYAQNAVGGTWATPSLSFETTTPPPLEITEFMADNATTLYTRIRDSAGQPFVGDYDTPDWIEIHNPTDATAVLDGFHLTDDLDDPKQWAFPAGTSIGPFGYLIVFASGDDITDPDLDENGYLHTNFKLKDEGGEDVALSDVDGAVVFAYEDYPVQSEDDSYGIDGAGEERFFPMATPGWDNANEIPQAPRFTVASTTFTDSIVVDLIARYPTDTVRYTTNETLPTAGSPVWSGPMTLTNTTMIRALAIGAGGESSRMVSEAYIELGADMLDDNTNLPIVIVETFGDGVPGSTFGDCFIAIIEPGGDGRARLTDPFGTTTRGGIHVRGSSSAGFTKKQYRVEFWDESNEDQKLDLLGMPAEADWIFYGPGQYDRALINNPLVFDLSNQVGQYATRTKWVELYLNIGGGQLSGSDYYGAYAIMEVIEQGDDRIDIEDLSSGAGGVPVSGGFAWKQDRGSHYVEPEDPNYAQRSYIDSYINTLNSAATGQHAAWADLDSFIDHNLLNTLAMNVDAMRLSGYYYKTEDGKLVAGPIWDFDRALESTDNRDNNPCWWYGTGDSSRPFDDGSRVMYWWARMFQDPDFVQMYIDRWFELRESVFSLANIYATIDAHAADLAEAAPRDYARWYTPRYGGFAGEIQHMKDWLTNRINWIDSQWLARPTFSIPGPVVTPGSTVTLHASTGDVWYTTDGTDPRGSGGGISGSAVRATGSIPINQYTNITARVYRANHVPSYGEPGYIATGDDWSAPVEAEYFVNPLVTSGDVVITEMNYHPHDATPDELATQPPLDPEFEDNDFEFIEFMNVGGSTVNISGVNFTDAITFRFDSHVLAPGERIVVVEDLEGFTARYGIGGSLEGTGITVAGAWLGELNNKGEQATVAARDGSGLLDFAYDDDSGWPGRADGKGATLELIDPWSVPADEAERRAYLENPDNWRASNRYGGSPGADDDPDIPIVVNEVLTHTDDPLADAIELHNTSSTDPVDISGWWLSDSWGWDWSIQNGDYKKFRIPDGTVLGPGEYRVFDEGHYVGGVLQFDSDEFGGGAKGFALGGAHGDDVWLMKADAQGNLTHFVDHVEFDAAANGESIGRWPDGAGDLYPMADRTLSGPNSGPRVGPMLISEVHYYPTTSEDLEFIEIYNPTPDPVNLWQDYPWKVEGFEFAAGTTLAPGEALLVVPFDPADPLLLGAFKSHYGLAGSGVQIVGPYDGYLDDDGETVRLSRPDEPPFDEPLFTPYLLVDEVRYDDQAPWPTDPGGGGTSLNRVSVGAWGNDAASWGSAAPTPGAADLVDLPPRVAGVVLNPDDDRTVRGVSEIDPSALGVQTVRVTFSEEVVFAPGDVTADKVEFDDEGNQTAAVEILPENITVSATAPNEMTITFADSWQQMVDTWVRITLADAITDLDSHPLDGEPKGNASGLGYIYDAGLDLPSGNGAAGGDAVFYVGSLRGDLRGFGPEPENDPPNGSIDSWDIGGFTQKFQERDLDADFRGFGPEPENDPPNGDVDSWDIGGFTSRYMTALATGAHLGNLPTDGGGGMAAGAPSPLPLTDAPEVDLLLASAAATPDGVARPRDTQRDVSRVAWPRLRGHVLPLRRAGNTVTERQAAAPQSPAWSPAASETAAAASDLDGGMVDPLAVPALNVRL